MRFWIPVGIMLANNVVAAELDPLPHLFDPVQELVLNDVEQAFIADRLQNLDLESCLDKREIESIPRNDFRKLEFPQNGSRVSLVVQPDVMRSNLALFYLHEGDTIRSYSECNVQMILPVLALMSTADKAVPDDSVVATRDRSQTMVTRQQVMAMHSFLTSYEPNRLMARADSDDSSSAYMDFTVSSKNPLLPNLQWLNRSFDAVARQLERITPQDDGIFIQPYLAFTGRFTQYLGARESSPVIARRFNPAIFIRTWTSSESYLDIGLAHESNGQRINSNNAYHSEIQAYLDTGASLPEATENARDAISRGWDYTFTEWHYDWSARLVSNLQLKHFLVDGPLQGTPEEYSNWEGYGNNTKPRRQFDGVKMEMRYDFSRSRCLLGENFMCFQDMSLIQETGYSAMFDNNTTTIEFTGNFFGLPLFFWGRTGYNSDLVDYHRYSNSWGLGLELLSR